MISKIKKFILYIEWATAGTFFFILVSSVLLEVIFRFVLHIGVTWTEELARFSFIWTSLIGAAIALEKKGLHDIDILIKYIPNIMQKIDTLLVNILIGIMLAILIFYGIKLTELVNMQVSPTLEIRMSYVYVSIPIAASLMLISVFLDTINILINFKKRINDK